jgi:CheY-like chemotaxis protein
MACFGLAPYRCRACRNRFFRFPSGNGKDAEHTDHNFRRSAPPQSAVVQSVTPQAVSAEPAQSNSSWPFVEHLPAHIPIAHSLLIVSRDPAIRKLLCKLLAQPGYDTHQLEDVAQLPSELQARKVDLLITDLDLPEQQGLETVAALRSKYPNLKIIALSGLRIAGVPGSIVLPKPFRRELLLESVQDAFIDAAAI